MHSHRITHEPGERFGRLVIVQQDTIRASDKQIRWLVQCDCDTVLSVIGYDLRTGHTTSCGCWRREVLSNKTHGQTQSPKYHSWSSLRGRCLNPSNRAYARYGGRGITVCDRWQYFENFLDDMGTRPSDRHSIDRIDNDGPYSPDNCRWATLIEQARNKRRTVRYDHDGRSLTLREWAETTGMSFNTLSYRVRRAGWTISRALTRPLHHSGVHV